MLAEAGVPDVFLSYNLVGPNIGRAVEFRKKFPQVSFQVQADHAGPVAALGRAMAAAGQTIEVLLDLDVGQHRTGIPAGPKAKELYQSIARTPGLRAGGFHVYDDAEARDFVSMCNLPGRHGRDELRKCVYVWRKA